MLPRPISLLRGALLSDGSLCDVEIAGDTVVSVLPAGDAPDADPDATLDLTGFVLLTAPAEPHAHLDKALSWDLINPPMGDLGLAIRSWQEYSAVMTVESIADRAREQALTMLRNGITAIRCHVDVLTGDEPMRGVEALVRVREELRDLMDIELVALAGPFVPSDRVELALDLGVDLVGGAPHLAEDPIADLARLLEIAERRGVGVDIHTDEALEGQTTLLEFARIVRDWPATQPASAGHCVRLGTLDTAELDEVITAIRASDIGIISLPITNLYLQGWQHPVSTPRGLTALRALLDAGVRVGAGADNVRDPFNPVGRSDALETASLLVTAGHLTLDEAYSMVSAGSRSVMSLPVAGPIVGAKAELLAVRGTGLSDVIANASADRFVIHAGRLVAHSTVTYAVAAPAPYSPPTLLETR
ncbi:amidohydrolase family protein [Glaciihabitans sp. dw_435]|uniref:amidohydrolase family protein n=1 Tax=Glaciihabitans sp. dw_435 TaxID=2720081 RepID=UPI001BD610A6|nr:amidohydrolase family protein [Glaciihabitans sp. dw_435]